MAVGGSRDEGVQSVLHLKKRSFFNSHVKSFFKHLLRENGLEKSKGHLGGLLG